jgi:hypothetical protein
VYTLDGGRETAFIFMEIKAGTWLPATLTSL